MKKLLACTSAVALTGLIFTGTASAAPAHPIVPTSGVMLTAAAHTVLADDGDDDPDCQKTGPQGDPRCE
jgi:hypothetical protein